MTRTLRYLLLIVFTGLSGSAFAQAISGRVLDDTKQPLPSAVVQVSQGGIIKGGAATDFDGNYLIKPLDPGYYDVMIVYIGLDTFINTGVIVKNDGATAINVTMTKSGLKGKEVKIVAYKVPLVDQNSPDTRTITREQMQVIPTTEIADLVALAPGVIQTQRGAGLNIGGARQEGTTYIIDGVVVQGQTGVNMSQGGVDQLEVITSGISAKYGDVSGGIVNITSRGVSQKFTGDLRVQHSIDGYNNNLASFSVAGPLFKKKDSAGHKKPVLGFSLSGDFYDDHDRYPTYDQQYVAKGSVLQNLQANPLKIISDNSGNPVYNNATDYITLNDLQKTKIPPNNVTKEIRLGGKLDYQVTDNVHLVAGGNFDYVDQDQYNRALIMFSPQATPVQNTTTGRGFLRFTQKFGKNSDTGSHSIISNAFYSVQADYQILHQSQQDPNFKHNIFDYAYIGQFTEHRQNVYFPGQTDSASGKVGTVLFGNEDNGITFNRSELNKNLANYTTEYYNSLNGVLPTQTTQIEFNNALVNGDEPNLTYGLFYSPGTTISGYSLFNSNQYALTVDASFDLKLGKTTHAIEFGLYYQQRIEKSFSVNANYAGVGNNSLWSLMRGLVSSVDNGNLTLDKTNPLFRVNGNTYTLAQVNSGQVIPGPADTIFYNYKNVGSGQDNNLGTTFDQNLRKKLGLSSTQDINIDALAPSTFSLGMFSADELLSSGNPYVNYQGYTYTGAAQSGSASFNDFWLQKDANGNYTRPIGAFSPNYIAGYLLDQFSYKDIHFNIGVRVDRYDANTKVLIDPYSEYAEETINQVSGAGNTVNGGKHPANLSGNTVVYVDDNSSSSPTIVGYRSGNNWYDPTGKYVEDPSVLKAYSNGRDPQPVIVKDNPASNSYYKITDPNYNPNKAFTDYTPQVNVQPRLSFSFPISTDADFYAHYDIYSQRPTTGIDATAYDYYYLNQNSNQIINNANLKPQTTIDYEVGFQQQLSKHSALTLTAFYKERKDMIAIQPYLYAFPTTYYTYGNRDFSTAKGSTLFYDLRATNHLRMSISYTLQFAEGTGSSPYSTNSGGGGQISPNGLLQSFIEAGLPNLRYVSALTYDSRHNIVGNIDYRYGEDEGPTVGGMHVLQNAGVDIIAKARSGEPYTRYSDALGNTVVGGINGSRLPWHYGVDLRVDKDFALTPGRKHPDALSGEKIKHQLYLKAIIQVNNLLNTRDILGVYGYTGKPGDNGYLTSAYGQQFVPQQVNPASYSTLYTIAYNNPYNLNYARTISFALQFDF